MNISKIKTFDFKPIVDWKINHNRNIDIALDVAKGGSLSDVGYKYSMSAPHISSIFRTMMANLFHQLFKINYKVATKNPQWFRHKCAIHMVERYKYIYGKNNET